MAEQDERAAFEAEYRRVYPVTAQCVPDKFRTDFHGDYEDTTVMVAWRLWQSRAALAATPAPAPQGCNLVPVDPTVAMDNDVTAYVWSWTTK